jgi:hypothetical protein
LLTPSTRNYHRREAFYVVVGHVIVIVVFAATLPERYQWQRQFNAAPKKAREAVRNKVSEWFPGRAPCPRASWTCSMQREREERGDRRQHEIGERRIICRRFSTRPILPQFREHGGDIGRQRGFDFHRVAGGGVGEAEPAGVQGLTV